MTSFIEYISSPLNCLRASAFILNCRCQPLFIYEILMSSPTSSSHSRVLSTKNTFSLHVLCTKAHWRLLAEVSHVRLFATNRLDAVEDDRRWWYAAFLLMLIRLMLITLHNDDFQQTTPMVLINKTWQMLINQICFKSAANNKIKLT